MIEIGKQKEIVARHKVGGKLVPVTDEHGKQVTKTISSEVWRVTRNTLGHGYGPDSKRKLVVGLINGDVLVLKPLKTRQVVTVELKAVYGWLLRNKALKAQLEKARARKTKLADIRARRSRDARERRFRQSCREQTLKSLAGHDISREHLGGK